MPKTQYPPNGYALWVKALHAWQDKTPSIDISTLTVEDFELGGASVSTVKNAIENGFLKKVANYDDLTEAY